MFHFYSPWKTSENHMFPHVFSEYRNEKLVWSWLIKKYCFTFAQKILKEFNLLEPIPNLSNLTKNLLWNIKE